ncbi:mannonate dehydratase [Castellaniella sp.]|uniref:mannonate dehydratase n=1 Tax=Castellaniella sp. TaxID=1955812 RepID=UPI003560456E
MRQTWRWFGPHDAVSVDDMLQAGVQGVVTALHHVPVGEAWSIEAIRTRQAQIARMGSGAPSGLAWEVVESLPVSEDIKKQQGHWKAHIAHYQTSLRHLARCGIEVVCYNFMPVLDWTRTDLGWRLPHGGTCMRFDVVDFAVFDIHLLRRPGAAESFSPEIRAQADARFAVMDTTRQQALITNVICGLPGGAGRMSLPDLHGHLQAYRDIDEQRLRRHFHDFLEQVAPVAQQLGLRLCCHPDDPPWPLLGLPRIMSTEQDHADLVRAVDLPANGITLCAGSLGARADNDLPGMMRRLGERVHFLHLRNVRRESNAVSGSFHEAEHLAGDTDMVALMAAVVAEEQQRRAAGRLDHSIPFRPDHGQNILDDLKRQTQPGYPAIGRLRGLAELRGVMTALEHSAVGRVA